jgi:cell division protein FtsW (lipid II flippase)
MRYFYSEPSDSTNRIHRFGLAGLARRWLVYPGALIWPSTLASTVLFRALHEPQDRTPANGWVLTRYKFFAYFTIFAFVIFWFPDFIWTSLSAFAFITWLVPHNQKVNAIFGVSTLRVCKIPSSVS